MPDSTHEQHRTGRKLTAGALAELGAFLTDIDWRLLHWLLRYPLQRADDLVVGIARWASRATVFRHMQGLQSKGLVESVLPKTPRAGKRLYHLSNLGLHTLAGHLDRSARVLARRWQADEAGLLRLLPRLPTLLVLQEVVNGLVTYAAEAMTTQGRRPRLVRWTWQRNVTHRFQYREQRLRFFTDGAAALCIRTQQGDGSTLDRWYGLFLLSTELDDERLMRLRLERLLCWRESPRTLVVLSAHASGADPGYISEAARPLAARSCSHCATTAPGTPNRSPGMSSSVRKCARESLAVHLAHALDRCVLSLARPAEATATRGIPALAAAG